MRASSARIRVLCVAAVCAAGSLAPERAAVGQSSLLSSDPTGQAPWDGYFKPAGPASQPGGRAAANEVTYASRPFAGQAAAVPASHSFAAPGCCEPACEACATSPWYVSISGGWQHRETVHEANDPLTFIVFRNGFAANAALGYRFDPFRIEAEYSFMNNDVDIAGAGGLSSPAAGNVNLRAFMFNLYHDVQVDLFGWQPFLGAGIGIYQSEINSLYPDFFTVAGPPLAGTAVNTTSDMPLAYQFRIGVLRPIGDKTEFFTGYRYFRGEELEFAAPPFSTFAPTFHPDGAQVHSIEFGLRVNF